MRDPLLGGRTTMMRNTQSIWLAAATCAALSIVGSDARAAISDAFTNDFGDIEMTIVENAPPLRQFDFAASSQVSATYVCANALNQPLFNPSFRQTINAVLERTERLSADFSGRVFGFITLNHPFGQVSLICPGGFTPKLARVRYTRISVRSELGTSSFARDVTRVFISI
jgi:hypothetical protein